MEMHNSVDIFPAIKLNLDWDVFFQSVSAEFERRENVCCADKNFGGERPLVTAGERLACSRLEDLLRSLGEKRNRASTAPLTLPFR